MAQAGSTEGRDEGAFALVLDLLPQLRGAERQALAALLADDAETSPAPALRVVAGDHS